MSLRKCRLKSCRIQIPSIKESNAIQQAGFCVIEHRYEHEREKANKAPKQKFKPAKKKLKSIAALRNEVAELVQKLVRLKEADENGYCQCWTCPKKLHWKEMQGGHFIERTKTATKMLEENIHPQCGGCNQWGMKKASTVLIYRAKMVDMYGADFVIWLEAESKKTVKHTRDELESLKADYSKQITYFETRMAA